MTDAEIDAHFAEREEVLARKLAIVTARMNTPEMIRAGDALALALARAVEAAGPPT